MMKYICGNAHKCKVTDCGCIVKHKKKPHCPLGCTDAPATILERPCIPVDTKRGKKVLRKLKEA